jgi:hypothetical protein
VNCFEKLQCFDRVDLVFDGDENGTIAGLGLRECRHSERLKRPAQDLRERLASGDTPEERQAGPRITAETRRAFFKPGRSAKAPQRTVPTPCPEKRKMGSEDAANTAVATATIHSNSRSKAQKALAKK